MQLQALPGFRDFYPEEFLLRRHLLETWRTVALRYGFEEYDGPPLEPLDLYTAKSGDEIIGQLYQFIDKGGREVVLRPEMTPTLARMVGARARGLKKPIRWFSMPQLFRYERQQRGRLREHFQLNCDILGEPGPLADAEIIALAIDVMRALGLTASDVRVRLSDRRLLNAVFDQIGVPPAARAAGYQVLDKAGRREAGAARQALLDAGARPEVLDRLDRLATVTSLEALTAEWPGVTTAAAPLGRTLEALGSMGLVGFCDFDLTIVRGLAYYTGTVFELFDAGRDLRAICGGGRYDDLLSALGGEPLPALGFGMGDVVLGELLRARDLVPSDSGRLDLFLGAVTADDLPSVLALARECREAGYRVEYPLGGQSLAKQLKLADARRARAAVVTGPDDRARGEVVLRDLSDGSQQAVPRDQVLARLVQMLGPASSRSTGSS